MGLVLFLGCAFFVFGPLVSFFYVFIRNSPVMTLIALLCGTIIHIPIFLASGVWFVLRHLLEENATFTLVFCALAIECMRYVIWLINSKIADGFGTNDTWPNTLKVSIASGWGIAMSLSLIKSVIFLSALGPGDLPYNDTNTSAFLYNALTISPMSFYYIASNVLLFYAYKTRNLAHALHCILLHMAVTIFASLQGVNFVLKIVTSWALALEMTFSVLVLLKTPNAIRSLCHSH